MFPDHTGLIEEHEAFVCVSEPSATLTGAQQVLAFRSPSYFGGDLRKLKLVTVADLVLRAKSSKDPAQKMKQCIGFFNSIRCGIVLSCNGDRSEADKLSGGDYDGDKAWVSWNSQLVDVVADAEAIDTSTAEFQLRKSESAERRAEGADIIHHISYARHFKGHLGQLGLLAKSLDLVFDWFGLESKESMAVGTQAFLQVRQTVAGNRSRSNVSNSVIVCEGGSSILSLQGSQRHAGAH